MIETEEDKVIGQIIHSFGGYAIGDLRENVERPIAAFILGCCLIDQLSCFRYAEEGKWETFIKEYMSMYKSMELCDSMRNKLVHNYSLKGYYKIGFGEKPDLSELPYSIIYADDFIRNIEAAFNEFAVQLRMRRHEARTNAIEWNRDNKILVHSEYNLATYSEKDADYLIEQYSSKIGKPMTEKQNLKIKAITKKAEAEGTYSIRVWAVERDDLWLPLDEVAKYCKYQYPQTLLKRRDSH